MRPTIRWSVRAAAVTVAIAVAMASSARSECTNPILLDYPTPFLTGPNSSFIALADFNEDGIIDLAVTNVDRSPGSVNSSLAVLIGTGNRTYAPRVLYTVGGGAVGVVARDFNEDGITDLAVTKLFSNNISVLIGQGAAGVGSGTFAAAVNYPTGPGPFELVSADFNGDGILDLATCLNVTQAVCVLPGHGSGGVGDGAFGSFTTFPINNFSTGLVTGDFNHDGIPDLVATEYTSGSVGVLLGTGAAVIGAGSFSAAAHYNAGAQPYHIEVADFNEDSSPDLAVANTAGGGVWVLLGLPNGTFVYQASLNSGNSSAAAPGDLNGDGILDIVTGTVTGTNSGIAEVFLGQGAGGVGIATFGPGTTYASGGDVYQVIVEDLDQDGGQDALIAQGWGSNVALLPGICAEAPPDLRAPVLTDVRDVPNDNGGHVFLTWTASSLDAPGGPVNAYRVWRRIPAALVTDGTRARLATREVIAIAHAESPPDIVYWEALATLPAQRLPGYGYTAATTQDSLHHSNPYTALFITALTSDIDVFYSSIVDSGYSVDNIRPHSPNGFTGAPTASGFSLNWEPGDEIDVGGYRLYRGSAEGFVPSEGNLIATPQEPGWVDTDGQGQWFYKLSAVDVHENESDFSILAPVVSAGLDDAAPAFALHGARPNPSLDGRLRIHFTLPGGTPARLELVDLSGRRVLSRSLSAWGAGSHVLMVGESEPLPPGIYFVQLMRGNQSLESKVVVAR